MKLPHVPDVSKLPDLDDLQKVFATPECNRAEHEGRYLHWEELRFRKPPKGISLELWWWAVRNARQQVSKSLPLVGTNGRRFTIAMTDTAQRLVHGIDRDATGTISLPEDVTNPATRDRYIVNSLIEEAVRSSQLEGASTTRAVAKEMIRTQREPRDEGERMVLNNFHAMEWVRENREKPLTVSSIFELHRIVTLDTLEHPDAAGRFRRSDEDVKVVDNTNGEILHTPPHAELLPKRIEAMCAFANGSSNDEPFIHPVARAIMLHFWLAYDHPFVDGNGRTARALFYWSMLNQNYWLTEFISISRVIKQSRGKYDRAFLYAETDSNDGSYFLFNQLQVLRTAIDDLHGYLKRKAQEVREVEQRLRGRDDLNNRQLAVLNDVLRHPDARITIDGHAKLNRVVYQTARTDLLGLVELGYLHQYKQRKTFYFVPAPDLQKRLKPQR